MKTPVPSNFFSSKISAALFGDFPQTPQIAPTGSHTLPSYFDVTGIAVASIGAACAELAGLNAETDGQPVTIDQHRANAWFDITIKPDGWDLPPAWDTIAGVYETQSGWIRLHTNAQTHRDAALRVLQTDATKSAVTKVVQQWDAQELEAAIIAEGGCAAQMRSLEEWQTHPHGKTLGSEPLIAWQSHPQTQPFCKTGNNIAPLHGVRVLDCTRVLAGPVCTRFLAGLGATVLRLDPPGWDEGIVVPEVTLGKSCATLDLKTDKGCDHFKTLLRDADIFVHGMRPGAFDQLGISADERRNINPDCIDITLNAYGWTGPWAHRRGYDSLVQMSSGIAHAGMVSSNQNAPHPLPVQALDHATGYLMAASAIRALRTRQTHGEALSAKLSLARTAHLLSQSLQSQKSINPDTDQYLDYTDTIEATDWGPARRVEFPLVAGAPKPHWSIPAGHFHKKEPAWPA